MIAHNNTTRMNKKKKKTNNIDENNTAGGASPGFGKCSLKLAKTGTLTSTQEAVNFRK